MLLRIQLINIVYFCAVPARCATYALQYINKATANVESVDIQKLVFDHHCMYAWLQNDVEIRSICSQLTYM